MIYSLIAITTLISCCAAGVWLAIKKNINGFIYFCLIFSLVVPYEIFLIGFSGGLLSKISPYSILVISYICTRSALHPTTAVLKPSKLIAILTLLTLWFALNTYLKQGLTGFGVLIDNHITTVLLAHALWIDRNKITLRRGEIVNLVLGIAFYSILEFAFQYNFIYNELFLQANWIDTQWSSSTHRSTATIGHPLIAATIFAITLASLRPRINPRYFLAAIVLIMAIVSTGSRSALLLSLVLIPARLLIGLQLKQLFFISVCSVPVLLTLFGLGFFDHLIYRIFNSGGSDIVRIALLKVIPLIVSDNLIAGNGLGSHGIYSERIGFFNAIESAWIALIIEIGVLGLILYLTCWGLLLNKIQLWKDNSAVIIVAVLMFSGFNSIALHTPMLIFLLIMLWLKHDDPRGTTTCVKTQRQSTNIFAGHNLS